MDYSFAVYLLVVLLAASQAATCLPINHDSDTTDKLAPQINVSLVDFCFFNQSGWKIRKSSSDTSFLCSLVTSNKTLPKNAPHKLLDPVRAIYADYVKNLKNDQQTVFECFILLPNLTDSSKSDCWKVIKPSLANDNDTSRAMTLRESNAQMYQDYFAAFVPRMNITFVDYCYYKKIFLKKMVYKRSNVYRFCHLISIRQKAFPDPLLSSMQDMYADYEVNERNDRQTVLDCYLKHHLTMEDDDCWKVVNRTDYDLNPILKREVYSRAYLNEIDQFYDEMNIKMVDFCWYNETLWKSLHPNVSWAELHFCQLITSKVKHTDEKISSLQQVYADYTSSCVNDEKTVLKCFLANINNDVARSPCWKVLARFSNLDSITSRDLTKRENATKAYLNWLEDRLSKMSIAYMDHCYYNYLPTPWYKRTKVDNIFCDLIVNKTQVLSHPLLVSLRELFDDYARNEKTDYERVWECFVPTRDNCHSRQESGLLTPSSCLSCWKLYLTNGTYKLTSLNQTRRYANAKSYNEKLVHVLENINYLHRYQVKAIKHCALYHRGKDWYRCPEEFVDPKAAPSNDEASIGYYIAMLDFQPNVAKQFDMDQIDKAFVSLSKAKKLRLSSDQIAPLKPLLYSCVNDGASSLCQNVTKPVSGVRYSAENKILQKVWKHAQQLTLEDDIKLFHNNSHHGLE